MIDVLSFSFARYIVLSTITLGTAFVCACDVESTAFKADSYGITLRGGYRLDCGDGELSTLTDSNLREIIPSGVVLSVFRSGYCIGYYDGGAFYERDGERINVDRVFFIIDFWGKLSYYEPDSDDCRFYGHRILEPLHFQAQETLSGTRNQEEPGDRPLDDDKCARK